MSFIFILIVFEMINIAKNALISNKTAEGPLMQGGPPTTPAASAPRAPLWVLVVLIDVYLCQLF